MKRRYFYRAELPDGLQLRQIVSGISVVEGFTLRRHTVDGIVPLIMVGTAVGKFGLDLRVNS